MAPAPFTFMMPSEFVDTRSPTHGISCESGSWRKCPPALRTCVRVRSLAFLIYSGGTFNGTPFVCASVVEAPCASICMYDVLHQEHRASRSTLRDASTMRVRNPLLFVPMCANHVWSRRAHEQPCIPLSGFDLQSLAPSASMCVCPCQP
mmetsp:Transcript_1377/g.4503  ORF Transcript_1377/g.4503 Transcript_1377/m.4503 type:complete len:149 (-) Transcript_1377:493-939(-)